MKLNLRQQRILSDLIDRARKQPGLHTTQPHRDRNSWIYGAEQTGRGTIHWWIADGNDHTVLTGECS